MRTIHRLSYLALTAACSLLLAACGGNDNEPQNPQSGPAVTTLTPDQTQAPNLPSVDGYLISASASEVILKTADGDQTFDVDEQDAPELGIEHMASHAGITTLGFRVFYEQQGDRRFVKQATEIPPPPLDRPQ